MFENLIFLNPYLWFFSLAIWIIAIFFVYKTKNIKMNFKFYKDLEEIFWKSSFYFKWFLSFLFLFVILFSLIFANPNLKNTNEKIERNWIDIVIVFDLSLSMLAEDIKPNRLEMAKQVMVNFVDKLESDRVWLVNFSWKPFVWSPLTFDYDFLSKYIKNISIQTINQSYYHLQWTAIWDALLYWINLFDDKSKDREKVMVLLTDGEVNRWIEPMYAVRLAKEKWIKVHTVWIAWDEDAFVIYWWQKMEVWWIDEKSLKSLAEYTSWKYYRVKDDKTFEELFSNLNLLDKKKIEVNKIVSYTPIYEPFVYMIVILFLLFLSFNFYYYLKN